MWDLMPRTLNKGDWVAIVSKETVNFLPVIKVSERTITLLDKTRWNRWTGLKWGTQTEQRRLNTPWVFLKLMTTEPYLVSKEEGFKMVKEMADY
jgi:hypothetical protein